MTPAEFAHYADGDRSRIGDAEFMRRSAWLAFALAGNGDPTDEQMRRKMTEHRSGSGGPNRSTRGN